MAAGESKKVQAWNSRNLFISHGPSIKEIALIDFFLGCPRFNRLANHPPVEQYRKKKYFAGEKGKKTIGRDVNRQLKKYSTRKTKCCGVAIGIDLLVNYG